MDSVNIHIVSYGIAKDIIGLRKKTISLSAPCTIEKAKEFLLQEYPAFKDLVKLSFALEEEYRTDDYILSENDELIIIPPVSGG